MNKVWNVSFEQYYWMKKIAFQAISLLKLLHPAIQFFSVGIFNEFHTSLVTNKGPYQMSIWNPFSFLSIINFNQFPQILSQRSCFWASFSYWINSIFSKRIENQIFAWDYLSNSLMSICHLLLLAFFLLFLAFNKYLNFENFCHDIVKIKEWLNKMK